MQPKIIPVALFFALLPAAPAFEGAPRHDRWTVVGPGGGGANFLPAVSPHDVKRVLVSCDMTGAYISYDGARSWRMFNLGGRIGFFVFDMVDPSVIYAKTLAGPPSMEHDRPATYPALFRSSDNGVAWTRVRDDSAAGGAMSALAVDPSNSAILYAAFETTGAYDLRISKDRGRTWTGAGSLPGSGVQIFVDPRSSARDRTIYVAAKNAVAVRERGAWRTGAPVPGLEGGRSLAATQLSAGFRDNGGKPVFYVLAAGGIFVSGDGGASWRKTSLPALSRPLRPVAVATSLRHPDVAYVSYNTPGDAPAAEAFFGVAKTADCGGTWKLVWKESTASAANVRDAWLSERFGPGWGGNPFNLAVAPTDPNLCYGTDDGRTMRTTDGGATWDATYSKRTPDGFYATTGLDVTTNYGVHFDPFDAKRMFIGYTDIGLFRSEDGGKSWTSATIGVPESWANTTYWMAFDPGVRGRVWGAMSAAHDLPRPKMFAGGQSISWFDGGVCRSDDGAKTWKCNAKMPPTAVTHVLLDPNSPAGARVLYATGFGRGVFKSTDGGDHWELKNAGIAEKEPLAWRLVRDANGTLYLVVVRRSDDGSIGNEGDGALYRSTDGAEHWTRIALPEGVNGPHGLAIDPADPKRLYLAAWGRRPGEPPQDRTIGGGIFLSADGGASWRQVLDKDQHVYDVTIDPRDPKVLYACGFEASAWRSADKGASWRRIRGFNFRWGHRVIPDPADPAMIYVTTYGGGVWHGPSAGDPKSVEDLANSPAR